MTKIDAFNQSISLLAGKKIVVDLTPMLAGGENGGAKLMTIELVNALASRLPDTYFVLLTAEASHAELDWCEKTHPNIQRVCVLHSVLPEKRAILGSSFLASTTGELFEQLKGLASRIVPSGLVRHIKKVYSHAASLRNTFLNREKAFVDPALSPFLKWLVGGRKPGGRSKSLLQEMRASLLFCPFTAPFYADPRVPTVSIIYDLQHRAYPQFFSPEEVVERENNFRMACQNARYLVAISEFVRQTVIEAGTVSPERVTVVPIGLLCTPTQGRAEENTSGNELLKKHGLRQQEYIFYPANFWPHKNHAMLLTAFSMYRYANPNSKLKLLCTGTPGRGSEAFCDAARRMGLADWVVYSGFVTSDHYQFLLKSAFALVFPSLYEGFGMPVLEAMSMGVPVLCSNVTSLPEVAGKAALYFDPRRPGEILRALKRLSEESGLRDNQIARGFQHALLFEGADRMADTYTALFAEALVPTLYTGQVRARYMENEVGT